MRKYRDVADPRAMSGSIESQSSNASMEGLAPHRSTPQRANPRFAFGDGERPDRIIVRTKVLQA